VYSPTYHILILSADWFSLDLI